MLRESISPEDDLVHREREVLLSRAIRTLFADRRAKLTDTERAIRECLKDLLADGRKDLSYAEIGTEIERDPTAVYRATGKLLVRLLRRMGVLALLQERQRERERSRNGTSECEDSAQSAKRMSSSGVRRSSRRKPLIPGATVDEIIDALVEVQARSEGAISK